MTKKVKLNQQKSDFKDIEINKKTCFSQDKNAVFLKSSRLDLTNSLEKETNFLNENHLHSGVKNKIKDIGGCNGLDEIKVTGGCNGLDEIPAEGLKNESDSSSSQSFGSDFSDVNGSDLESDKDDSDLNGSDNEVQVDFEFENYCDIDYHGLKSLLKQVFAQDIIHINDGDMADLIIKNNIGCTVKVDDNLDPFAMITCFDKSFECSGKVFDFLSEKTVNVSAKEILASKTSALLINDRLINMPPQIVPNMFRFLFEDMTQSETLSKITHLVYISKLYTKVAPTSNSKKRPLEDGDDDETTLISQQTNHQSSMQNLEYFQVEDEFIEPLCDFYFDYQLPHQQVSDSRRVFDPDNGLVQSRRVFFLNISCPDSKKSKKVQDLLLALDKNLI